MSSPDRLIIYFSICVITVPAFVFPLLSCLFFHLLLIIGFVALKFTLNFMSAVGVSLWAGAWGLDGNA